MNPILESILHKYGISIPKAAEADLSAAFPAPAQKGYSEDFERVWAIYPDRSGKSKADSYKAYRARLKEGATADELESGVRRYAEYCRVSNTSPTFIKQPATFFGPGRHYEADWTPERQKPTEKESNDSAFLRSIGFGRNAGSRDLLTIDGAMS